MKGAKSISALIIALAISGCMTTPPAPPMKWNRIDGRVMHEDAKLQQQFEVDFTECRGDAAQSGSGVQVPSYHNLILLSAAASQRNQTILAVMGACMAKRGYLLKPST